MTLLTRIFQAIASLAGIDVAGAAVAESLRRENADLRLKLTGCIAGRGEEASRHAAVVRELEAANARLRDLVRRSGDPADVLDSLAGPGPAAAPPVRGKPPA